jgi:hypothetical protein
MKAAEMKLEQNGNRTGTAKKRTINITEAEKKQEKHNRNRKEGK